MKIVTICYGQRREWNSRKKAMDFFLEGAIACEGSESERYLQIYSDLAAGKTVVTDEY